MIVLMIFSTDFVIQTMQKLLIPFEMRGYQRVYNLEKKVYIFADTVYALSLCGFLF